MVKVATGPSAMRVGPPAPTVPVELSARLTPAMMARHPGPLFIVALVDGLFCAGCEHPGRACPRQMVLSSFETAVAELPSPTVTVSCVGS